MKDKAIDKNPHERRTLLTCDRGLLQPVEKQAVWDRLPPGTRERFVEFYRCSDCGKIFRPGPLTPGCIRWLRN